MLSERYPLFGWTAFVPLKSVILLLRILLLSVIVLINVRSGKGVVRRKILPENPFFGKNTSGFNF